MAASTVKLKTLLGTWSNLPARISSSPEWSELAIELEVTGGGGPATAVLASRALATCCTDDPSNMDTQNSASFALQTFSWEKLHTGSWRDVSSVWRDVYTLACLCRAAEVLYGIACDQHRPCAARFAGALKHLDLATLMGGPRFRPMMNSLIDDIMNACFPFPDAITAALETEKRQDLVRGNEAHDPPHAWVETDPWSRLALSAGGDIIGTRDPGTVGVPLPPFSEIYVEHGQYESRNNMNTAIVKEQLPSLSRFVSTYMAGDGAPVLIEGVTAEWRALRRWQCAAYLRAVAGPRTVPVEVGRHYLAEGWGQRLMMFSEFLDDMLDVGTNSRQQHENQLCYLAQHDLLAQIPALGADVAPAPEYCTALGRVEAVNTWMGPPGTITPTHTDPYHNFLCQVVGKKYVRLYSPEETPAMYPGNDPLTSNSSQVDVDAPDADEFPKFLEAPFLECVLGPGDALYIPPGWWHYVKSLTASASVSFWWESEGDPPT